MVLIVAMIAQQQPCLVVLAETNSASTENANFDLGVILTEVAKYGAEYGTHPGFTGCFSQGVFVFGRTFFDALLCHVFF